MEFVMRQPIKFRDFKNPNGGGGRKNAISLQQMDIF